MSERASSVAVAGPAGGRPRPRLDRESDRRITVAGIGLAAAFAAAAVVAMLLPAGDRLGYWLPLHLALAGAASTAVAAVLPFFTVTLAVAPPAPATWRWLGVALVAGGAVTVATGHAQGADPLAATGAAVYLGGLVVVAGAAFAPLRGALGPRRRLVERAYAIGLAEVLVGAGAGALFLAGTPGIVAAWAAIKPGHAWLNLLGFLALVVNATLVHLAPTVAGTRIRPRRSATLAVGAIALGGPLTAAGYWTGLDAIVRTGAALTGLGAGSAAWFVAEVVADRRGWTTDRGWHVAATGHLVAGAAWFTVGAEIATTRTLLAGADPSAWRLDIVAAPLAGGWILQVLAGAWTHLVPPLGGGDPNLHARRRRLLGRIAAARLLAWNVGVGCVTLGLATGLAALSIGGAALGAWAVVASVALLVAALRLRASADGPGGPADR
jgi:nitrite reductase (NO-forming)